MKYFILILLFSLRGLCITGSTYDPSTTVSLQKERLNFSGQKVYASVPFGTTQDIDLTITDDYLITGAQIILAGNCELDEIQIKVMLGTTVMNQFIDWYAQTLSKELPYPAKLIGGIGLKLRATYKNTCTSGAATVRINYSLHKVL